ncbi:serine/threonine-protein kinase [Aestuariispira ectoiniformans]|uniref:serine/threonine-protein kinase n=1 Tax=Aestuariispira ectoiniformans TaxID=2775080 RepID=UPI00223AD8E7|nr:serine/threonine-protein kinase [Aestuariispira ectoiniformans]
MAVKIAGGEEAPNQVENGGGGGVISLKGRYDIYTSQPLPDYDSSPARAFHVRHKRDSTRKLMAYLCDPKLPPRLDTISALHRVDHRNFVRVLDWDVLEWPGTGQRFPIIVCECPMGKRVLVNPAEKHEALLEEQVTRMLVEPAVAILRELHTIGVYHGRIRPDNLFYDSDERADILIGECYTTPFGMQQLPSCSTIEAIQCTPGGRGHGSASDDLYALGATMLALLTGRDPGSTFKTEEELLHAKLTYGSYSALVQGTRVSLSMMEPLRGLLNDDPRERWSVDDLGMWLGGRRLSPKQQAMPPKASRALKFAGRDLFMAREVAHTFGQHWDQILPLVQEGTLDTWLRRSLADEDRVEAVNVAKGVSYEGGQENADRFVGRLLISLDPERPIQLRDYAGTVEGVCRVLALNNRDNFMRQTFRRILSMGLIPYWLEMQVKNDPDDLRLLAKMEKGKHLMNQNRYGAGLERMIYDLNNWLPCRSPLFDRDYVPNIDYLLDALERYAERSGGHVDVLVDKEIAAYISIHSKRPMSDEFRDMDLNDPPYISALAQLSILAKLHDSLAPRQRFPNLCQAAASMLKPAIERFHSRETRKKILDRIEKATKSGRLAELVAIIDNRDELQADENGFQRACLDFARLVGIQAKVYRDIRDRKKLALLRGGQIASGLAGIIGMVAVTIVAMIKLI